jgi:hypothetical protein
VGAIFGFGFEILDFKRRPATRRPQLRFSSVISVSSVFREMEGEGAVIGVLLRALVDDQTDLRKQKRPSSPPRQRGPGEFVGEPNFPPLRTLSSSVEQRLFQAWLGSGRDGSPRRMTYSRYRRTGPEQRSGVWIVLSWTLGVPAGSRSVRLN